MAADFLELTEKNILLFGVANRKSVAWHIGQTLIEAGANVVYVVRSETRREAVCKLVGEAQVLVCDVEFEDQIEQLESIIISTKSQVDAKRRELSTYIQNINL